MRLFEAIVAANHRAATGDAKAGVHPADFADSLPIVALTCVDPRLNRLLPEVLGVPEEQFIWLRNAGNIITGPTSSTMRSLALACAVKDGREIALIGHSDCRVRQTSMVELTDRLRALGLDRARLPDNLNEFFGLFASERQNVLRGVEFIRQSPLIGARVPVHGLLLDVQTGKVEWLVNGYEALQKAVAQPAPGAQKPAAAGDLMQGLRPFEVGEMKFPEVKIGEAASAAAAAVTLPEPRREPEPARESRPAKTPARPPPLLKVDRAAFYKVMGDDKKVYGPVPGNIIEQWLAEGRIDGNTLAQKLGYKDWRPLVTLTESELTVKVPIPPSLPAALRFLKGKKPWDGSERGG